MKITIFGASGAIGKILTKLALDDGNEVVAYIRNSQIIEQKNKLKIVVGELNDEISIDNAIKGSDIVISTLGPALDYSRKIKDTVIANGHKNIINSMNKHNLKRIITLATPTIRSDDDVSNFKTFIVPLMAKILFPNGYKEMKKIERIIKNSSLNWTVVRMINPNVKYKNSDYEVSIGDKPFRMNVSRENVAAFIYKVAKDNSYIKKMPIVFNK